VHGRRPRGEARDAGLDILDAATLAQPAAGPEQPLTPDELLASRPPAGHDLSEALAARPARRRLPALTVSLAAAALIGAGFLGGALVQKHEDENAGAANPLIALAARGGLPGAAGGAAGGQGVPGAASGGAGAGGLPFSGGNGTIGTVKLVDGTTVYVQGFDGTITKVTSDETTKVQVSRSASLRELRPGSTVVVQGRKSGGAVAATSITEGGRGGGLGALPGSAGGSGGANGHG
jgi:hypothetical protein